VQRAALAEVVGTLDHDHLAVAANVMMPGSERLRVPFRALHRDGVLLAAVDRDVDAAGNCNGEITDS
jgi:hypothetical protein